MYDLSKKLTSIVMFLAMISLVRADFEDWVIQQRSKCYVEYILSGWNLGNNECPASEIGIPGNKFSKYTNACLVDNPHTFGSDKFSCNGLYMRCFDFFKRLEQFTLDIFDYNMLEFPHKRKSILYLPALADGNITNYYPEEIYASLTRGLCILFDCNRIGLVNAIIHKFICKPMELAILAICRRGDRLDEKDLQDLKNVYNKLVQVGYNVTRLKPDVDAKIRLVSKYLEAPRQLINSDDEENALSHLMQIQDKSAWIMDNEYDDEYTSDTFPCNIQ
jgi:hypothetical protein